MSSQEKLKQEALLYFRTPAFHKFFVELSRKFYHQGSFGKSVGVQKFSPEELAVLMPFMGYSEWEWSQRKSISVGKFLQSYQESRFSDVPFNELVEKVIGKPLCYKQEVFQAEQQQYLKFEGMLQNRLPSYINYLSNEKKKGWFKVFIRDEAGLKDSLLRVKKALDSLPINYEKIPYFAYRLFRDPHQLDRKNLSGRLFFDCLETITQLVGPEPSFVGEAEWENAVYEHFYLLKDDSFNAVQINGLVARSEGKDVQMWLEAAQAGIAWNIPLKHILEVEQIGPFHGDKVLFVENSGVFSIVCEAFPQLPIVCSSGQFRYSVWKMAEKIVASGNQIYYAGDLDPAGLQMAQKILRRFTPKVSLLLMDQAAYDKVPKEVRVTEEHLRQLGSIKEPQLLGVRELLKTEKLAGYQEGLLDELFQILKQW